MADCSIDYLVVGLGNPGEEYAQTRHNAGFCVLDRLAQKAGLNYWKNECGALTAKTCLGDLNLVLAKPQSYMNASGGPVKKLLELYGLKANSLIVVHDELDINAASVRVKFGGGHAGHNGLKSICEKLGTRDWYRVRVGIGRPPGRMNVADFVLSVPKKEAADQFAVSLDLSERALESLLLQGLEKTQQDFN